MYRSIRQYFGGIFQSLAEQKGGNIVEEHVCVDHVHMLIEIPLKHFVAHVVGFIKVKNAIAIARSFVGEYHVLLVKVFLFGVALSQWLAAVKKW